MSGRLTSFFAGRVARAGEVVGRSRVGLTDRVPHDSSMHTCPICGCRVVMCMCRPAFQAAPEKGLIRGLGDKVGAAIGAVGKKIQRLNSMERGGDSDRSTAAEAGSGDDVASEGEDFDECDARLLLRCWDARVFECAVTLTCMLVDSLF